MGPQACGTQDDTGLVDTAWGLWRSGLHGLSGDWKCVRLQRSRAPRGEAVWRMALLCGCGDLASEFLEAFGLRHESQLCGIVGGQAGGEERHGETGLV